MACTISWIMVILFALKDCNAVPSFGSAGSTMPGVLALKNAVGQNVKETVWPPVDISVAMAIFLESWQYVGGFVE